MPNGKHIPNRQVPQPELGLQQRTSSTAGALAKAASKTYDERTLALIKQQAWLTQQEMVPYIKTKVAQVKECLKEYVEVLSPGFASMQNENIVNCFSLTYEDIKRFMFKLKKISEGTADLPADDPDQKIVLEFLAKMDPMLAPDEKALALKTAILFHGQRVLENDLPYTKRFVGKEAHPFLVSYEDIMRLKMELGMNVERLSPEHVTAVQLSSSTAEILAYCYRKIYSAFEEMRTKPKKLRTEADLLTQKAHAINMETGQFQGEVAQIVHRVAALHEKADRLEKEAEITAFGQALAKEIAPLIDFYNKFELAKTHEEFIEKLEMPAKELDKIKPLFLAGDDVVNEIFPSFKESVLTYISPIIFEISRADSPADVEKQLGELESFIGSLSAVDRYETLSFVKGKDMMNIGLIGAPQLKEWKGKEDEQGVKKK